MKDYLMRSGSLAAIAAAALVLAPGTAFGQRGASSNLDDSPETVEQAQPAPHLMQHGQMKKGQHGQMQRGRGMQAGAQLTERERLEKMRENMIAGMRRMAVRMTAIQNRILALDRGEPDAAPPVEMGRMGRGMQMEDMQRGNGMQMRDGGGMDCKRAQPSTGRSDPTPPSTGGADR